MRAHHKLNLGFGEPDFSCRLHGTDADEGWLPDFTSLVARPRAGLVTLRQTFVYRCQNCEHGCALPGSHLHPREFKETDIALKGRKSHEHLEFR